MNLTDTHSHVYQEDFDTDIEEVITRSRGAGISSILMPNVDVESIENMHRLADCYPGYCIPMMGLHPTSVKEDYQQQLKTIESWFSKRSYIAVGEIGLDLYWDKTFFKEQTDAFETQIQWSIDFRLPVVIHNREAFRYVMESLRKFDPYLIKGVFHSFGGTREELEEILSLPNFMLGINGVVTFKNSKLDEVIQHCPTNRIILETDAPYLTPVPFRGKRNEPAYMVYTLDKLSGIFQISANDLSAITSTNARKLFNLA